MHKQYPAWARWYRANAQIEAVAEATPLIASNCSGSYNGDVLALLERCYRTTDRYDKEQGSVASASACLAGTS